MAGRVMRAVRVAAFGGPQVLRVDQVPIPSAGKGQAVVKVMAAGVNPVETYIRSGNYAVLPQLPYTPGNDGAGIVEEVGEDVSNVKVGDRVYLTGSMSGTYAQYTLCQSKDLQVLPERLSFAQGAAIGVAYRTAYRALFMKGHGKPSQRVLIHGASGGVGLAAVQLAAARGMVVIGTAGTDAGLDTVRKNGARHVVNHREEGYSAKIMEATGGKGVDLIIEMLANVNLAPDMKMLARNGMIAVVGNRGNIEINPRELMMREASVVGVMLYGGSEAEAAEMQAGVQAGMEGGALAPIVGPEFPLDNAPDAHVEVIEHPSGSAGKVILNPWA